MSFQTSFDNIDYVEIDGDTIRMFQNNNFMVAIPKSALSVMIMLGENILLDLESRSSGRKKYWSDENSVIYTKRVFEVNDTSRNGSVECRVLCIMEAPYEIVLKKEAFQLMLISAAVACRIDADPSKSRVGSVYNLNNNTTIIFRGSQRFSIADEACDKQFVIPMIALAEMIMLKNKILRDLCETNYFGGEVYWSDEQYEIITESHDERRVLTFVQDYRCDHPSYISISSCAFERMIHIATSGPSWTDHMNDTMKTIRFIFWKSIPINTVKSVEFSRNGREFTLVNEVNGETLTLPIDALEAAQRNEQQILYDLDDYLFDPTYERDFMNEYWTDGVYAIRTGAFINLSRDIDCNVVRFVRLRDNYYHFVVQRETFLYLLEEFREFREDS